MKISTPFFILSAVAFLSACAPANSLNQSLTQPDDAGKEPIKLEATADVLRSAQEIAQLNFQQPNLSAPQQDQILSSYAFVDPNHVVPDQLLKDALLYYNANLSKLSNKAYVTVVDFSQYSANARLYIINMSTGAVWAIHVAHGSGSDPGFSGYATKFSNVSGTNASSLGYYKTAETYSGNHGLSLRLDGLSSTNTNVRQRDIVVHGASYVYDSNQKAGRSWGCLAVSMANRSKVIQYIKSGSLIYAGLSK